MTRHSYWLIDVFRLAFVNLAIVILCSCSGNEDAGESFRTSPEFQEEMIPKDQGLGISLFGFGNDDGKGISGAVAVNAFLWRASLDTLSFMPIASADPFGGIIITDWYTLPETLNERFKVNVYILGRSLRADGLKVTVFRQTSEDGVVWRDKQIGADVEKEFEDAVLTRARQLRLQAVAEEDQ